MHPKKALKGGKTKNNRGKVHTRAAFPRSQTRDDPFLESYAYTRNSRSRRFPVLHTSLLYSHR